MNIYITKENTALLDSVRGKRSMSGLINELLDRYRQGVGTDLFPAKPEPLETSTEPEEVESDYLDGLVFDTATQCVYEEESREQVEADATMVKELKKRGQVK